MKAYWKKNLAIIVSLLVIWALVSLVAGIILAIPLYGIQIGQLPLSFWFAQQGSIIIFIILIFYYAWRMDRLDQEYDVHEYKIGSISKKSEEVQK